MKRILIIILLMAISFYGEFAFGQADGGSKDGNKGSMLEKVLIDFAKYDELNSADGSPYLKEKPKDWEKNPETYLITQDDMSLVNWVVRFNSSADVPENKNSSYAKKVQTKGGEDVLGVRIYYPKNRYNVHAEVRPVFEIMEYNKEGEFANVGNGVIDNVGELKALSVEVSGRNINNRLYLRLIDSNRKFYDYFMGYLGFAGWRRLVWKNPYYISSIDQRDRVRTKLYPQERPYLKFHSFIISRLNNSVRGDFVVYFKRVEASYDKAEVSTEFLDVDDEKAWGIQRHRMLLKQAREMKRQSEIHLLREMELKRVGGKKESNDVAASQEANQGATPQQ